METALTDLAANANLVTSPAMLTVVAIVLMVVLASVVWRWASRVWSLPCPSLFGWALESPLYGRMIGTEITLQRMALKPGQRILEIGPGPGRLLIPAAQRIRPGGEAVGIDIQPRMVERLRDRAKRAGVTNLQVLHGDATQSIVAPASFDVAFLATALGEIPDRKAALAECFRALKPGGTLLITELLPDPHYQSRSTVRRLATAAGFEFDSVQGGACLFTARFIKPGVPAS